jgi:hypothetical protein
MPRVPRKTVFEMLGISIDYNRIILKINNMSDEYSLLEYGNDN